ncbi:MAG: DUF4249 domain-containing protein [Cyclobacteriaceae bacterium]
MVRIIILGLFMLLGFSCQEEIRLDLDQEERIPIIEAIWTDDVGLNQVIVSYTRDYYDTLDNEIISDATVQIEDETTGEKIDFRYINGLKQYLPLNSKVAIVGHEYRLLVTIDGKRYFSAGKTLEPPTLDSITYQYEKEEFFRPEGYYLTIYGKIPFKEDNFYRLKMTRNDTLLNRSSDYFLFDDTFGSSILNNGFELMGFTFKENDKVKLELYRMNEEAFDYLNQLVSLLFNDGGLFSPPPENPKSNIQPENGEGRVLGYFMTAPVLIRTIVIQEEDS